MGQGLGKNSPVILQLGKENYEALISRHGQWVRWRIATKCPCVKYATQQPDIHCTKCGGLGVTYSFQSEWIIRQTVMNVDQSGIIELDKEYADCQLIKCYDNAGNFYPNATKVGNFVFINTDKVPNKGVYFTVILIQSIVKTIDKVDCEKKGSGYYEITKLEVSKTKLEGLYHTAPADIIDIDKVIDGNGIEYKPKELRLNYFYIEPTTEEIIDDSTGTTKTIEKPIVEPIQAYGVKYIPPFTFVILNQNLSKTDVAAIQEYGGDAMLSFPYNCNVAEDDVVTVLSGTYTMKAVVNRKIAEYDTIPAYFVDDVISCIGKDKEYIKNKDFILVGANYLKWISENSPKDGEAYSISYKVFPTYRIVKAIPQLRTSEDQRMPKKAVIKLYDTYGEKRGVNRQ